MRDVPVSVRFWQRIIGINGAVYWPVHRSTIVSAARKVHLGQDSHPGLNPGCYINASCGIIIGSACEFGSRVGLISRNHDLYDLSKFVDSPPIEIGDGCVLEDGVVVTPGVSIAANTLVKTGSVVTKSVSEPGLVLAGAPAKPESSQKLPGAPKKLSGYHGYINERKYLQFQQSNLIPIDQLLARVI